ncbi:MAG: hypothetical protein Q4F57_09455 [Weeksellaceae bacterium]|nr:hypothetical protein [Weeksellaceae bacterium]
MLNKQLQRQLDMLGDVISQFSENQFTYMGKNEFESSPGMHVRHVLDFFLVLQRDLNSGVIDYDKRVRNTAIEENPDSALSLVYESKNWLESLSDHCCELQLNSPLHHQSLSSTLTRELLYLLEHCVHHFAIIRVFTERYFPEIMLHEEFGLANSTIQFQKS